jgi:RNA polymerase sigma factor (sigma-70 family)
MASGQLGFVLRHLRRLLDAPSADALSDAGLLQRFNQHGDQDAFALLVQRHGPLVQGVCRRVLRHEQDAEDAFQATFLVLARKAASIRQATTLGTWLYEVAYHIALKARADTARRQIHEREARTMPRTERTLDEVRQELRPLLDEELHHLPERYRQALVLCDLQGQTHQQAARELGVPPGSVSRHLGRARELLRERLIQRGITLSTAVLVAVLVEESTAPLTAALVLPTAQAALWFASAEALPRGSASVSAVTLARGALHAMFMTKVKIGIVLAVLGGLVLAGTGALAHQLGSAEDAPPVTDVSPSLLPQAPVRLDRLGDPLPAGAVTRLGTTRFRLSEWGQSLVFAPDGKSLVSGSYGGQPQRWDITTSREMRIFGSMEVKAGSVALSPDGQTLAGGGKDIIYLWDVASGKELRQLAGHSEGVNSLAFSPDGKLLASGGNITWPPRGQDNPIRIWDVATGQEVRQFVGHKDTVHSVAFSPDGKTLISGGGRYDPTLRFWDMATGQEIRACTGHGGELWSVAFAPDGKMIATGSMDKTIRLWDAATGKEIRRLKKHKADVFAVAFSPDGRFLASGGFDKLLCLWDLSTGKEVWHVEGNEDGFQAVAFSPDSLTVAAAGRDHTIRLWDVASGQEIRPSDGPAASLSAVAFAPDGQTVLTAGGDRTIRLWDAGTGKLLHNVGTETGPILCAAFSPDARFAATGGEEKKTCLWDVRAGKKVAELAAFDHIYVLAFSPDGKTLAAGNRWRGPEVTLWDLATGKPLRQPGLPRTKENGVVALAFAPDGKTLAGATFDGLVYFWDVATGAAARPEIKHGEHCQHLAFSPDGRMLAAGDLDGSIRLWDMLTGRERLACRGYPFCFSPDGRFLATGTRHMVHVWDLFTGKEMSQFPGHRGDIRDLSFSPDGRRLASGSADTTALLWDTSTLPRSQQVTLSVEQLSQLWDDLGNADAAVAYRAVGKMVLSPGQSIPFLTRQIHIEPAADPQRVERLVRDLDNDDFAVRTKAVRDLEQLGESVEAPLRKAVQGDLSLEARRQVDALLEKLQGWPPAQLRLQRALEALEHCGTPGARAVLERVAREAPAGRTSTAAKESLERLTSKAH